MAKIRKGDLIVLVVLVVIGIFTILFSTFIAPHKALGSRVIVEVDGKLVEEYRIDLEEQQIRIETDYGYNVLRFQNDRVRIAEADCPDQICVRFGWIQRD